MRRSVSLAVALAVLLALPGCECAKKKKRKRSSGPPKLPAELETGCTFWRSEADADAKEVTQFARELERDGRKAEALPCYVMAIRVCPTEPVGYLDLAVAKQYEDPPLAIKLYQHGLRLKPTDHDVYNQYGILLRTNERQNEAMRHFVSAGRINPLDADSFFRETHCYKC